MNSKDKFREWVKEHRIIIIVSTAMVLITALGSFTGSLESLKLFFRSDVISYEIVYDHIKNGDELFLIGKYDDALIKYGWALRSLRSLSQHKPGDARLQDFRDARIVVRNRILLTEAAAKLITPVEYR